MEGKFAGSFSDLSEEQTWTSLQAISVNHVSRELVLRVTPQKLQGRFGVVAKIAETHHNLVMKCELQGIQTNLSELGLSELSVQQLCDILRLLAVTLPKGNKPVLVEAVADLFAQQDDNNNISNNSISRNR